MEELIKQFLSVSDGSGSGSGSGDGDGYGYGDGSGSGSGDGYGDGDGDGYGDGVKAFNHQKVYQVDNVPTLIDSVHRMYAKGRILNKDLTTTPVFIARVGNSFAHGATLRDAQRDAQAKDMENRPVEQRLEMFVKAHPHLDVCYDGKDLYEWHHVLTGSCKAGRDSWCANHGLNPSKDKLTAKRFIELTKDSYGGDVIRELAKAYGMDISKI